MGAPQGPIVLICALDPDGTLRTLELDASDRLKVLIDAITADLDVNIAAQDIDVEVIQQDPDDLHAGIHGWISSAWKKQAILFNAYSKDQTEEKTHVSDSDPDYVTSTAVPAGEIWNLNVVSVYDATNACTKIELYVTINGKAIRFISFINPAAAVWQPWNGSIIMSEGDTLSAAFYGPTASDWLSLRYNAIVIDIDQ